MDMIGHPEQVLNSIWLNHRYTDLIGYPEQVLNSTWINHRYTYLIGYQEKVLNSTWLNHRYIELVGYQEQVLKSQLRHRYMEYGSDWLFGAEAQDFLSDWPLMGSAH